MEIGKYNVNNDKLKLSDILKYATIVLWLTLTQLPSETISQTQQNTQNQLGLNFWQSFWNEYEIKEENNSQIEKIILKSAIKHALKNIKHINDIPKWWIILDYRVETLWIKMPWVNNEYIKTLSLPHKFDISPKAPQTWRNNVVFYLWNRKFEISPKQYVWKIKNFSLSEKWFRMETTFWISVTKDKEEWLPDFISRLRETPKWKWEKEWFTAIDVKEL